MTIRCSRQTSVAVLAWFLLPATTGIVSAQSPWQVTVTPTLNPLPIGLCGAVQVMVRDATGGTPRNGLGARASIADFDMTVTAPGTRSVASQQIDAFHWSVCACSGAAVGAVAIVTASYPARALPSTARVPGLAFNTTATFVIAPAKGSNPPACLAPPPAPVKTAAAQAPASAPAPASASGAPTKPTSAPKVVSAPAAAPPAAPGNAKPAPSPSPAPGPGPGTSSPAQQQQQQQEQQQPATPPAIPNFPATPADWAALQKALGSKGWAELQKEVEAELNEPLDDTDDKPPPGVPSELMGGRNHAAAVTAFKTMLPVMKHARCINCHTDITYWDDPGAPATENSSADPPKPATHKGGDINTIEPGVKDNYGGQKVEFMPCTDCHTKAPPEWANSGPRWTDLDDYQLCLEMKRAKFNGEQLLDHLRTDNLVKLAFQGQRAMDLTPAPPPLSHAAFLKAATEWINRMDAMKKFPQARSEGCPRTDAWSGSIEYTYTEVGAHSKQESHGVVHILGGLAKWNALAARQEDHSAKNCPSVYSASAAGEGRMQLVTIDYTSEKPVSGFAMPNMKQSSGTKAPEAFVGLTIFPGKYSLSIDLPMTGSGRYQGGGPACPGYKSFSQPFDAKIGEGADGKFDRDNPDEISGTKTETLFPGATFTMKWQFMRLNEDRGR